MNSQPSGIQNLIRATAVSGLMAIAALTGCSQETPTKLTVTNSIVFYDHGKKVLDKGSYKTNMIFSLREGTPELVYTNPKEEYYAKVKGHELAVSGKFECPNPETKNVEVCIGTAYLPILK